MTKRHIAATVLACSLSFGACRPAAETEAPALRRAVADKRAMGIYDALEQLIDERRDRPEDRAYAYQHVRSLPDDKSAGYAFARAAIAGRLAELRGVQAGGLVGEAEQFARQSHQRDPEFMHGAATRMLGTLYVLAPATLLRHGDSERGLELLELLAKRHPEVPENHLRVAEAYVALGDPDPARAHMCLAKAQQARLRPVDRVLLVRLIEDIGGVLACV